MVFASYYKFIWENILCSTNLSIHFKRSWWLRNEVMHGVKICWALGRDL